ncbi:MAG: hypothetical protein ACK4QW_08470 [Alphaproteobacteria bacterium]
MQRFEPGQIRDLVSATTGVALSDASAGRAARSLGAAGATLDRLAGDSMFDTEPAQLVVTLGALKGRGIGV